MESFKGTYEAIDGDKSFVVELSEEGGVWTMKSRGAGQIKFKIGEEFEETNTDGREYRVMVHVDGNKLITEWKAKKEGDKSVTIIMDFMGDVALLTEIVEGTDKPICTLTYNKIA